MVDSGTTDSQALRSSADWKTVVFPAEPPVGVSSSIGSDHSQLFGEL